MTYQDGNFLLGSDLSATRCPHVLTQDTQYSQINLTNTKPETEKDNNKKDTRNVSFSKASSPLPKQPLISFFRYSNNEYIMHFQFIF